MLILVGLRVGATALDTVHRETQVLLATDMGGDTKKTFAACTSEREGALFDELSNELQIARMSEYCQQLILRDEMCGL
jgi:hypothetical protein